MVALRKVNGLLDAGGKVRLISPAVTEDLLDLITAGDVEWFERGFAEGDLKGAFLVFAATDRPEVQRQIMAEALQLQVMCNSADNPKASQFHTPAHFRRGQMLLTVSTGGGSPALAKKIRQQLENIIGAEYEAVVYLLELIRKEIVSKDDDISSHGRLFSRLLACDLVVLIKNRNWFELQMVLIDELPAEVDGVGLMKKFIEQYGNDQ